MVRPPKTVLLEWEAYPQLMSQAQVVRLTPTRAVLNSTPSLRNSNAGCLNQTPTDLNSTWGLPNTTKEHTSSGALHLESCAEFRKDENGFFASDLSFPLAFDVNVCMVWDVVALFWQVSIGWPLSHRHLFAGGWNRRRLCAGHKQGCANCQMIRSELI